jgi:hypothetical protein
MQNKHNNFKICTLLQNLSNIQKYANARSPLAYLLRITFNNISHLFYTTTRFSSLAEFLCIQFYLIFLVMEFT